MAPGRFDWDFRYLILQIISVIDGWGISCELALRWMPLDLTDDKSTLVQVMAWCRQATSHYLSQCWPRSVLPYGFTRAQWVNKRGPRCKLCSNSSYVSFASIHPHQNGVNFQRWNIRAIILLDILRHDVLTTVCKQLPSGTFGLSIDRPLSMDICVVLVAFLLITTHLLLRQRHQVRGHSPGQFIESEYQLIERVSGVAAALRGGVPALGFLGAS